MKGEIEVPRVLEKSKAGSSGAACGPDSQGRTILVVDDEPDAGRILSRILGEQGFTVQVATSGEEGLRIVQRKAPELILLDVVLPGMGGIETLRRMKALRPSVSVILMTGHETVQTAVEAMKLGAYDYLPKPLTPDRLVQSIQQALRVQALEQASLPKGVHRPMGSITPEEMVGQHLSMVAIFDLLRRVAPQDLTVLIRGESGTGKELIIRAIHHLSLRRDKPFVPVDCASLPESLFESELFGFEKGAFTGAEEAKEGRFELANGGTLFLDEVGNLFLNTQAKLLRVIQEREITRLGGKRSIKIDVRLLAATNQNLESLMAKNLFREDLFHRLNVFTIHLPPLRQRGDDVVRLAQFFLERFNREFGRRVKSISKEALELLSRYPFPGNVRELENAVKGAVLLADDKEIFPEHLPEKLRGFEPAVSSPAAYGPATRLGEASRRAANEVERQLILRTLRETRGNKRAAARQLGIDYKTLFTKLKTLGITREAIERMKE